ncbi:MAG: hypothetical protein EOO45_00395 [Flavobacterium sp.]|nr:MAG: hypothetical protein EOO45_00395 [Flavobacterium sp.]
MNKLLLKKIEELTLHLIEKDKVIRSQDAKINAEQNSNRLQEQRLKKLEVIIEKLTAKIK